MIATTCDAEQYLAAARDTSPVYYQRYMIDFNNRPAPIEQSAIDRSTGSIPCLRRAAGTTPRTSATASITIRVASHWSNRVKIFFNNKGVVAKATDVCERLSKGRHVRLGLDGLAAFSITEDGRPRVADADDGPVVRFRFVECLFRARHVVEFTAGVVVQQQRHSDGLAEWAYCSISMSPFELPAARIGRRPVRPQIRTGLTGPSSRNSGRDVVSN